MKNKCGDKQTGFTIIELLLGMVIIGILVITIADTYIAMQSTAVLAKHKSIASEIATNKIESLKALPYDSLAVAGGAIQSQTPLPNSETKTINSYTYTTKISINYIDDAFDGCADYSTLALKQQLCRNYPPPSGAPAKDLNPADYKIVNVKVYGANNTKFAELDTQIAARVAETDSTTGALIVKVIDDAGNPVSGATVHVVNSTISPATDSTDSTDGNGNAVFYGLAPDMGNDYSVTASKSGYSSLSTIKPSGSLWPTFLSQNIFLQLSSPLTLILKPMTQNSVIVETYDTSGNPISGVKVNMKGGYKKYIDSTPPPAPNTEYYYNNYTPTDLRPATDSNGQTGITDLVPGAYIFCGDDGKTGCNKGATSYTLAAAVSYGDDHSFKPVGVPSYNTSLPTFTLNSQTFVQKIRLILTTSPNLPVVDTLAPSSVDTANLASFKFKLNGRNLTCYNTGLGCPTTVKLTNGTNTYTADCKDDLNTTGLYMDCAVDLTGAPVGMLEVKVENSGGILELPLGLGLLGGVNVLP